MHSPPSARRSLGKKVTFFDFKGLMAPVFTFFKDDETRSLDIEHIDQYAAWLKSEHITGVLVNSITGEGPALGLVERKLMVATWWQAACAHNLICMVQIGGAPLPDVLELAHQAEELGVHAVLCLPELFYKPTSIDQLVRYCQMVSRKCATRPFFYYHIPRFSGIDFDMSVFCDRAEEAIPTFFGLLFSDTDLEMGSRCLRGGRVILLGNDMLIASALILGFDSVLSASLNIRPDLAWDILNAMNNNDLVAAKEKQKELNNLIKLELCNVSPGGYVVAMKNWFNEENSQERGPGIPAGPVRKFY